MKFTLKVEKHIDYLGESKYYATLDQSIWQDFCRVIKGKDSLHAGSFANTQDLAIEMVKEKMKDKIKSTTYKKVIEL